jgi:hypothetical protein
LRSVVGVEKDCPNEFDVANQNSTAFAAFTAFHPLGW